MGILSETPVFPILLSKDLDATRTFYRDTLGLEVLREDEGDRIVFRCGGGTQLATQIIVAVIAGLFSFILTYVIGLVIKAIGGLRLPEEVEVGGIDLAVHGETAYETIGTRIATEVE